MTTWLATEVLSYGHVVLGVAVALSSLLGLIALVIPKAELHDILEVVWEAVVPVLLMGGVVLGIMIAAGVFA